MEGGFAMAALLIASCLGFRTPNAVHRPAQAKGTLGDYPFDLRYINQTVDHFNPEVVSSPARVATKPNSTC